MQENRSVRNLFPLLGGKNDLNQGEDLNIEEKGKNQRKKENKGEILRMRKKETVIIGIDIGQIGEHQDELKERS